MADSLSLQEELRETLAKDIAMSAKELALAREAGKQALIPLEENARRIEKELWDQLKESDKRCSEGFTLFLEVLPELARRDLSRRLGLHVSKL
jgi:hypothetical protein